LYPHLLGHAARRAVRTQPLLDTHEVASILDDRHDAYDAATLDDGDLACLGRNLPTGDDAGLRRDEWSLSREHARVLIAHLVRQERKNVEDPLAHDVTRDPQLLHPALARGIQQLDAQILVHDVNGLAHRVDGGAIPLLRASQRPFRAPPGADVAADREDPDPGRRLLHGGVDLDRRHASVPIDIVDLQVADSALRVATAPAVRDLVVPIYPVEGGCLAGAMQTGSPSTSLYDIPELGECERCNTRRQQSESSPDWFWQAWHPAGAGREPWGAQLASPETSGAPAMETRPAMMA
jgi:hypothetical protein